MAQAAVIVVGAGLSGRMTGTEFRERGLNSVDIEAENDRSGAPDRRLPPAGGDPSETERVGVRVQHLVQ